ncbi:hypothetical protein MRX96_036782 [Rhipicephalus microplus]
MCVVNAKSRRRSVSKVDARLCGIYRDAFNAGHAAPDYRRARCGVRRATYHASVLTPEARAAGFNFVTPAGCSCARVESTAPLSRGNKRHARTGPRRATATAAALAGSGDLVGRHERAEPVGPTGSFGDQRHNVSFL